MWPALRSVWVDTNRNLYANTQSPVPWGCGNVISPAFRRERDKALFIKEGRGTACEREPASHYCPLVACGMHRWPDSSRRIPASGGHPPAVTSSCPPLPAPAIRKRSWLILTLCPPPEYSGSPSALLESRGLKQWAKPAGICFQAAAWPHSTSPLNSLQNLPPTAQRSLLRSSLPLQQHQLFTGQPGTRDWSSHLPEETLPNPRVPEPRRNCLFQLSSYTSPIGNKDPSLISAGNAALQNNPCLRARLSVQPFISGDSRKPRISTSNYRSLGTGIHKIPSSFLLFPPRKAPSLSAARLHLTHFRHWVRHVPSASQTSFLKKE